jgi:hypothetical protein
VKYLEQFSIAPFIPSETTVDFSHQTAITADFSPQSAIETETPAESPIVSVPILPIDFRDSDMVDLKTVRFRTQIGSFAPAKGKCRGYTAIWSLPLAICDSNGLALRSSAARNQYKDKPPSETPHLHETGPGTHKNPVNP